MKSNRWFNQNPFFSQLRTAAAVTLIAAAVVSAIASLNPDPPNTRLTNDNGANGGYVSVYTLATGNPYTDATLNECSISRGRQNEPAIAVDPRNTSVLLGSSNDYCGVYNRGVAAGAELLRSANNLFQLTNLLSLLVNEQLRVTDDVDEQDVPNLELEIRLRMSGHIPIRPSNYTPYTRFISKISVIRADCLSLFGILLLEVGARQQERPNGFELQSYRAAGLQG